MCLVRELKRGSKGHMKTIMRRVMVEEWGVTPWKAINNLLFFPPMIYALLPTHNAMDVEQPKTFV
jgi:hypothetical protein